MNLKVRTAEASLRVPSHDTAEAGRLSPEDDFPVVLTTSRMIELMELAASRLMKPRLLEGESSTSVVVKVNYAAHAPVSGTVRAVATCTGVSGRLHRFIVHVFDESGLIGSAEHTRAVVAERRLLALARRRGGKRAMLLNV
ncbi:MAG TPA: hypothetical protein VGO61_00535 [Steroidobacteraceae bacterium]|jgi:predicted thioesterase|nr:hypothetical protein [Steroidobacteraceae bacterium]